MTFRHTYSESNWYSGEQAIMGTAVQVTLWSEHRRTADAAIAAVMAEMHRIDQAMSPHKPASELSRINREAAAGPVTLSAEMCELLRRAIEFSTWSRGAFDITYASAGHLYDYRERIQPSSAQLAQARLAIGIQHLALDTTARTLHFTHPGTRIDLGGFAKGHAVDRCIAILQQHGIGHAVVAAGGDSRVLGDRRGRPWNIAVRDPRRPGEVVAVLPLEDVAVSTSGDYERFFEQDGERIHHVIDPRTGQSASGVRSVTIIAPEGLCAEAWSKTVFVLGVAQGLPLVEAQPEVDAVVVDAHGTLHCSSGLLQGGSLSGTAAAH